jgi:uncharacterized membrane protein
MGSEVEKAERKETGRVEGFSDGVFAFAITLLVLYLKDPIENGSGGSLLQGLLNQWPAFFAFLTSFMTILIIWVGHHEMFTYIRRIDRGLMFLNGLMLLFVTLTPFTTSLVADHILSSDSQTAAAVYSGGLLCVALIWGAVIRHVSSHNLSAGGDADAGIRMQLRGSYFGSAFYTLAFVVAFFSGILSVVVMLAVAVYWVVGPTSMR